MQIINIGLNKHGYRVNTTSRTHRAAYSTCIYTVSS